MKKLFFWFYQLLFLLPARAYAWSIQENILGKDKTGKLLTGETLTKEYIPQIIGNVIKVLIEFSWVVCFIFIIIGGYHYLTSGGNEEKASTAKATLTWAIAGLIIALGAFALVSYVQGYFKSGISPNMPEL
jgi:hypothetical protein